MQITILENAHLLFIVYIFPSKFQVFWDKFYSLLLCIVILLKIHC